MDEEAPGWALKNQAPLTIPDTQREQRFPNWVPLLQTTRRSILHSSSDEYALRAFLGALGLGKSVPEALNREEVEFLSRVALMGALALEKQRAARALEEQQSLVAISNALGSSLDLEKLLPVILSSLRSISRLYRLNSSRSRRVWARLTGISVCFLSSMRNWYELLNQGTTSRM